MSSTLVRRGKAVPNPSGCRVAGNPRSRSRYAGPDGRALRIAIFVKIDAKGYDDHVLKGMSFRPRGLCFEYNWLLPEVVERCFETRALSSGYEFNFSPGLDLRIFRKWMTASKYASTFPISRRMKSTATYLRDPYESDEHTRHTNIGIRRYSYAPLQGAPEAIEATLEACLDWLIPFRAFMYSMTALRHLR